MATKLKNLKVTSVDLVPAGANPDAYVRLFKSKTSTKTEGSADYPAEAYAYVPDPQKPSTWKLRLWESPDKKITAKQVGMAVAALGTGFRGNKAEIPSDDLPKVKAKVLAAWKKANPDAKDDDIPDALKKEPAKKSLAKMLFSAISKALGIDEETDGPIQKGNNSAETFADALKERQLQQVTNQIWDTTYAFNESLSSILMDDTVDPDQKSDMMSQSLSEFCDAVKGLIGAWSGGQPAAAVTKSEEPITPERLKFAKAAKARLEGIIAKADPNKKPGSVEPPKVTKGVTDTMKIDKSKMSPEEAAQLEAFEKKYGIADGDPTPPVQKSDPAPAATASAGDPAPTVPVGKSATQEVNPEVKKALDEVEKLKDDLQMERMTGVAKKYEVLGKKPDDVAKKLVELKKCGGTAYDDYVALLDEQVNLVEKSGLFSELGSNAQDGGGNTWDKVSKAADEVLKGDPSLSRPAAIAKACEQHPELRAEYDQDYMGR